MDALIQAISRGLRSVLHMRTLLPLWLGTFILGLLQSWPLWLAGERLLQRPFLDKVGDGGFDMLVDFLLKNDQFTAQVPIWLGLQIPVFIIQHVIYAICAGGMLSVYLAKADFGRGSTRFALPFIGLDIILTLLIILAIIPNVVLPALGQNNFWFIPSVIIIVLLGIIGEYARASAIVHERRNPFVIFGQALSFCARHLPGVALLALLSTLALLLVLGIATMLPSTPGLTWINVIIQQVIILVLIWIKALRLAWAGHYVQAVVSGRVGE